MRRIFQATDLDQTAIQEILQEHFQSRDLVVTEVGGLENFTGENDFYNSEIKKLSISYCINDARFQVHAVIKTPPTGFFRFMQRFVRPMLKETVWYTQIVPSLSKQHPIMSDITATCYYACIDTLGTIPAGCWERGCCFLCYLPCRRNENGLIMLEDLTKAPRPFQLTPKGQVASLAKVEAVMVAAGHYHGVLWQVLRDPSANFNSSSSSGSGGENGGQFTLSMRDFKRLYKLPAGQTFMIADFLRKLFKMYIKLLRNHQCSPELIAKVRRYNIMRAVRSMRHTDPRIATLTHGDLWSNNIMFRTDTNPNTEPKTEADSGQSSESDKSEESISVKFLDFQMGSIGSPIVDLCYFFYINTDREFREAHQAECLQVYFRTFSSYFAGAAAVVSDDNVSMSDYKFQDFMEEFGRVREGGMLLGTMVCGNVLSPNERTLRTFRDFRRMHGVRDRELTAPDADEDHPMIREIRKRMFDSIMEFDNFGYLGPNS